MAVKITNKKIPLNKLEQNNGQIDGVPANPRFISVEKFDDLKKSIQDNPEMMDLRELICVPVGEKFVVICGNMRLRALLDLGEKDAPCKIIEGATQKQLRAYVIKDNLAFGQDDFDLLANDWDEEELREFGADFAELDRVADEAQTQAQELAQDAQVELFEKYRDEVIPLLAKKMIEDFDKLKGVQEINKYSATINFLEFLLLGKEYRRYNSIAFHPQQFEVASGGIYSPRQGLERVVSGEIKAKNLWFVTSGKIMNFFKTHLHFSGVSWCADFPASLAKNLINEFCPKGGVVLDPCSGWGGRLVGFLASNAGKYVGNDASPLQVKGDEEIFETYKKYVPEKEFSITTSDFNKLKLEQNSFDFALTSPPYFDVEKYIGGEQSHEQAENYKQWKDTFYYNLIKNVYNCLKKDCVFCLQVGAQKYPLIEDGKKIAQEVGFKVLEVRKTSMVNTLYKTDEEVMESIIVLKKT